MAATRSGERSPGAVSLAAGRNPSEVVVRGRAVVRVVEVLNCYREAGVEPAAVECVYTPRHLAAGMGLSELDSYIRSTFNVSDIIISPCFDSPVTLHDGRTLDEWRFADILRADAARLESLKSSESVSGGKREGERRPVLQQVTGATPQLGWCGLGVETLTVAQDGSLPPCYTLLQEPSRWTLRTVASDPASTTAEAASIQERLDGADPRKLASCVDFDIRDVCRGCPGGRLTQTGEFTGKDIEPF